MLIFFSFLSIAVSAVEPVGDATYINQAWYLNTIEAQKAWDLVQEVDFKIGVIDMDFNLHDTDLKDVFDSELSKDFSGNSFLKISTDGESSQHGTLVSGLIAADGLNAYGSTGIVRKGRLLALNIAPVGPLKIDLVEVIHYAADSGVKVVNGSFGYRPPLEEVQRLRRAIAYARQKDVVLVFSAGNYHDNLDKNPFYPASLTTEFDNVISVGASGPTDYFSSISSFGKKNVDLVAPGEGIIVSHLPGQFKLSMGTSEAAPITAGVVALMRQVNPKLRAGDIKKLLLKSVDKKPWLSNHCVSGGRLNAYKAVKAAAGLKK